MKGIVRRTAVMTGLVLAISTAAAAQLPPETQELERPARRGGPPPGAAGPAAGLNNEQVYQLLDAFVMGRAQAALQLSDAQFTAFFQKMLRLQTLQRQHRRQRQRLLTELRQIAGPGARGPVDESAIAAKTKELDDWEAQRVIEEQKALAEVDQVLQVRQRAVFRLFLENMERQKLDLLMRARQGGRVDSPPPGGRGEP